MSPWNLSPSLHFGFSTILLAACLFSAESCRHRGLEVCASGSPRATVYSVNLHPSEFDIVFTSHSPSPPTPTRNLCSLAIKPTVIRPVVSGQECARPGGTLRCGSAEHERMSLKCVRVVKNWQRNKKKKMTQKKEIFYLAPKPHQITNICKK